MKQFLTMLCAACTILLFGCENGFEGDDKLTDVAADSVSITGFTGDSVKLVKSASLECKVKDVSQGAKAVSALAKELGGMITYSSIASTEQETKRLKVSKDSLLLISVFSTDADITARIPSGNLEQFLFRVSDMGYFTSSNKMAIDDKSLAYLASHLKQQNRMQLLQHAANRNVTGNQSFRLVQTKDEVVDNEIVKRQIDADVNYSVVQLRLFQNALVRKETIANDSIEDYSLPFIASLGNALSNGDELFLNFILAVMNLWAFILAGVIVWLIFNYYQQRRKRLLMKS